MAGIAALSTDLRGSAAAIPDLVATEADGSGHTMANAIRALAVDAVAQAGSGDAGSALGLAEAATILATRFLRFDAADPRWPDRDRLVLSSGRGSILLYALLHLTGHDGMGLAELRRFRQMHSPAGGHPEFGEHPAIEATVGPPGQGLATAIGMVLAERLLAARFGRSLVDHRVWVLAEACDLMEGISHEAAGLAGHLRLDRLAVLVEEGGPQADRGASLACSDDTLKRFAACGWAVRRVDGRDPGALAAALSLATRSRKPTLIACRGAGATRPVPFAVPDAAAPADTAAEAARRSWGWPHAPFTVPPDLALRWREAGRRGAAPRRAWLKRLTRHPLRAEFDRVMAGRLPDGFHDAMAALKTALAEGRPAGPTGHASRAALEALAPVLPELVCGSADLAGCTLTEVRGLAPVSPGGFAGRYIHYGVRTHLMAAAMGGIALHGGLIPTGAARLVLTDHMRPALRLAALTRQRVVHVLTHDSIGLGGDGPAHQPVEQLAGLRAMPNLFVFRPADAMETAECWELALRRADGPSLLVLTAQDVPAGRTDYAENRSARGGYVVRQADGPRQATLLATGSEVALALAARAALAAQGIAVAVVSLPCWELFAQQDEAWRAAVLGEAPRFGIEAACGFGWERWLGNEGVFIGMTGFGASAPGEDLFRHFGLTAEAVVAAVRRRLG